MLADLGREQPIDGVNLLCLKPRQRTLGSQKDQRLPSKAPGFGLSRLANQFESLHAGATGRRQKVREALKFSGLVVAGLLVSE
jgi:hypothetical protein